MNAFALQILRRRRRTLRISLLPGTTGTGWEPGALWAITYPTTFCMWYALGVVAGYGRTCPEDRIVRKSTVNQVFCLDWAAVKPKIDFLGKSARTEFLLNSSTKMMSLLLSENLIVFRQSDRTGLLRRYFYREHGVRLGTWQRIGIARFEP